MIIWINGAFGAGKTQTAYELNRRLPDSFIYDPENIGFFIRRNIPPGILKNDFQDYSIWRELNYAFIKYLRENYTGTILIPMTIVNPDYFNEIAGRLRSEGMEVKHFALMASKETLLKRLKSRGDGAGSWGARQIDRCFEGLSAEVFREHIYTDKLSIEEVVETIAHKCNIQLLPNNRSGFQKSLRRLGIKLRQVGFFK